MSEAKPNHNHFFVDGKRYESEKTALTGLEIKALASVPGDYQLFLEVEGDKPDQPISDSQAVDIRHNPHFFAVPPATFG